MAFNWILLDVRLHQSQSQIIPDGPICDWKEEEIVKLPIRLLSGAELGRVEVPRKAQAWDTVGTATLVGQRLVKD